MSPYGITRPQWVKAKDSWHLTCQNRLPSAVSSFHKNFYYRSFQMFAPIPNWFAFNNHGYLHNMACDRLVDLPKTWFSGIIDTKTKFKCLKSKLGVFCFLPHYALICRQSYDSTAESDRETLRTDETVAVHWSGDNSVLPYCNIWEWKWPLLKQKSKNS